MPNDHVFNPLNRPVYTSITNTFTSPGIVAPPENNAGSTGNLYNAGSTNSTTLGLLGGSVIATVQLTNPVGSGKNVYISRLSGGITVALNLLSSFSGTMTLSANGTLTSPSTLTPVNNNLSSSNTSIATVRFSAAAPTGTTTLLAMPLQVGPFLSNELGRYVVPPGQSINLSVSGSLSVGGLMASTSYFSWWEA
ncbi:hypothetical protein P4H27_22445 [Paenibacillus taichungensis]|uniref:BclA C-terminal domain-containing protein n=1 Tax=Paenibacillus taichungensis TaxID=484184 RepID=A0ABX2MLL3_9BACL|nr:hypothetical protein [Paenibacillus taichungensis]OME85609.1 hypothetical protein BK122_01645 [Paenibacillus pabuli]MDR9747954.1 hypothetical protein [Paenibacillus taichungensis]MEC0109734.1 hypothetical protein [Paenibacillus taichungensis]MEC0199018.1 hypothetical protein [Paenibacillus taichungensis]NUU54938.1 hypothetical protein [Paenibacillus taichungensis]